MRKSFKLGLIVGLLGLLPQMVLADDSIDAALRQASNEELSVVPFPAVPDNWTQVINGHSVEYYSPIKKGKTDSDSVVSFTYTRNTKGEDALGYILKYIKKGGCTQPYEVGHGFYTSACKETNTYAVVIGEVDNLYLIELTGLYDKSCQALIEGYVKNIVNGKHNFKDRFIGDAK